MRPRQLTCRVRFVSLSPTRRAPANRAGHLFAALGARRDGPAFYRGRFGASPAGVDTYLTLPGFTKGSVWVNGLHLGRYWNAKGPQLALYVPGPIVRASNELVVFEAHNASSNATVEFVDRPLWGKAPLASSAAEPKAVAHGQAAALPQPVAPVLGLLLLGRRKVDVFHQRVQDAESRREHLWRERPGLRNQVHQALHVLVRHQHRLIVRPCPTLVPRAAVPRATTARLAASRTALAGAQLLGKSVQQRYRRPLQHAHKLVSLCLLVIIEALEGGGCRLHFSARTVVKVPAPGIMKRMVQGFAKEETISLKKEYVQRIRASLEGT
mgnify:CR=1 FL=1